jgi:plastocyanin|tara:strand:+ start:493 stop:912 length:420 start_codon:yes stop_codon:yes gene_type:complete
MMMTVTRGARGQMVVAMLLGLAGLAMAGFMPLLTDASLEPREIVVVASDMAFYVDGNAEANPRIRMEAGETVRLVLWNKQPGVVHEFVVGAWQVATPRLRGRERDSLVFQVPEAIGHYVYECSPHSAMMRGSIEVVDVQ